MRFVSEDDFKIAHPQYLQGDWCAKIVKDLVKFLSQARDGRDWPDALDDIEGVNSVPIMTPHTRINTVYLWNVPDRTNRAKSLSE